MFIFANTSHWQAPFFVNIFTTIIILSILSNLKLYNDDNISTNDKAVFFILYFILMIIFSIILIRLSNSANVSLSWLLMFTYIFILFAIIYSIRITLYLTHDIKQKHLNRRHLK
jgi:hypothetical protein